MVRAGRTRDDRQFYTGSGRLERRNTLLPGSLCGGLQGGRWLMSDLSFDGVPLGLIYLTVGRYIRV
jgi:hypothetical protein